MTDGSNQMAEKDRRKRVNVAVRVSHHQMLRHLAAAKEVTVQEVLDKGFIAAFTIYPKTKMGNQRMVEVVKRFGSDRIIVDSSADWGVSDPLAVPKTASLMLRQGVAKEDVVKTCYQNALDVFGMSGKLKEEHWLNAPGIDQRQLFEDNSVLRGQEPRIDADTIS